MIIKQRQPKCTEEEGEIKIEGTHIFQRSMVGRYPLTLNLNVLCKVFYSHPVIESSQ